MPKKRLKQNEKRRYENFLKKREMKKILKEITSSDKKQAEKLLPKAYKTIDKAAKTNVIKKNTASRKKSRITKLVNQKENAK
ncbi:MAG: 30S ribosomal protein S20 [Candidatus Pacebacteria bacterium]|jgi:small subunit ribosomal protein S20|nr:30S ribosomal protein S20 [Candidatus Paceibacterota bacterium]MDD2796722.1 30S ribosomal protein S20 [Candidatus Paceibacterota bacterium]MDD3048040.1 30S ribosomal protein S20 [Candidatus Paceibacterota bacterium]MDD3509883.1 30S ribosomal protein S20 [Candidatus Paceibacterota bacterium]MDD3918843.1 30S ribosomal protein S20 [Candidatus Paceibacterota bacterium]